jgi:transposase InsO family protein
MNWAGVKVGVGTKFMYDGEIIEVVETHMVDGAVEVMTKDLRAETVRRFALSELMFSERARLLADDLGAEIAGMTWDPATVKWAAASSSVRREACARAAHVREALTGYRSGHAETALRGEPRAAYKPGLPRGKRLAAKADELGRGLRTIERWASDYLKYGEVGLISAKSVQPDLGSTRFAVFEQAALDIMVEHTDLSKPTKHHVIAHARARIAKTYGEGVVPLPCDSRAYDILDRLEHKHRIFTGNAKRNRDVAARSLQAYGKLHPTRPGEYLLMDTTRLDVFAMDPQTLRWLGVDLTVGMDWYSRCITGLRLTPVSTKAIDAAAVLYQSFRPMPAGPDWPRDAVWPPHGIPRSVLVEHEALDPASVLAATPAIVPETIVVDHGKIYVGETLTSACRQMGISIQPARIREGRDKGPVERFFRTIREGFLQELPGYKGPDLYSRGAAPEKDAFLFIDEMEALLREWVATVYHRREHDGIGEAGLWALRMSPTQMFEHGLARAGYIEAPRDPCLAYQFLQVAWRTIQPSGVQINNRVYRASVLVDYVGTKSPYKHRKGEWPIHINPDDIRQAYFFDLKHTQRWHILVWTEASVLRGPMNEDGLAFARQLAKKKHRYFDNKLALAELLERRNLSQGRTQAERIAALRVSREQSSLGIDLAAAVEISQLPTVVDGIEAAAALDAATAEAADFADVLDDAPLSVYDGFYDDVLEDV